MPYSNLPLLNHWTILQLNSSLFVSHILFGSTSINLSIHLSIHQTIHLSMYLSIYQSINLSIFLSLQYTVCSIHLPIFTSKIHLSIYLTIYHYRIHLSVYLSINLWGQWKVCIVGLRPVSLPSLLPACLFKPYTPSLNCRARNPSGCPVNIQKISRYSHFSFSNSSKSNHSFYRMNTF